jgi:hypothetical protein
LGVGVLGVAGVVVVAALRWGQVRCTMRKSQTRAKRARGEEKRWATIVLSPLERDERGTGKRVLRPRANPGRTT